MNESQLPKITRVDLRVQPRGEGVAVLQYPDGWQAWTDPVEMHVNATTGLEDMVKWFKDHGWYVREWPGGARAFLGKPIPVRSKKEILRMRSELERQTMLHQGHHPRGFQINTLDLAVDL